MQQGIVMLACAGYALFNVAGAALIKTELPHHHFVTALDYLRFLLTGRVIAGFSIILLSALIMFKALSLGQFSYVIPIATGINFALTVLVGVWLFHDRLTLTSWLGLLMILGGIMVMSFKR